MSHYCESDYRMIPPGMEIPKPKMEISRLENIQGTGKSGRLENHGWCFKLELDSVPGYLSCGKTEADAIYHALSGEPERYMGYLKQIGDGFKMGIKVLA